MRSADWVAVAGSCTGEWHWSSGVSERWWEHHTAEEGDINLYNFCINPSGLGGKLLILVSWPNRMTYRISVISDISCVLHLIGNFTPCCRTPVNRGYVLSKSCSLSIHMKQFPSTHFDLETLSVSEACISIWYEITTTTAPPVEQGYHVP